ncbi:polysaccharide biosynthesis tyrosine autokinase [Listeria booriae]|uniref:non-specific protein-tyrosine kinase n=1 Tax=Listeria booriae TaxID=1552123 RepID=A0A842A220_9LIST|nr:polysaccharide biosynthesis tyrosine autokinase [Listeria booriae]MBC1566470.1 polysaccharide biosynthesis tyrosine autokinase [Listeria booriae]
MERKISFSSLLQVFKKYYLLIAIAVVVSVIGTYLFTTQVIKPMYSASAWAIVKIENKANSNNSSEDIQRLNTYKTIATSTVVLENVKKELHLENRQNLQDQIKVLNDNSSQALQITTEDSDNKEAVAIANSTAESLKKEVKHIWGEDNIQIISPAQLKDSQTPISPNLKVNLFLAVIVGLIMSLIIIFSLEMIQSPLRTDEDFEAVTPIPVVGHIIKFQKNSKRDNNRKLITRHVARSSLYKQAAEGFRVFCANLLFISQKNNLQVFTFTSVRSGEGKSTSIANTAAFLGLKGFKVLVIDADLRLPKQHGIWNVPNVSGLTDMLGRAVSYEKCVARTSEENVAFIPSGILARDPSDLLTEQKIQDIFRWAKERYDFVLVDTPPAFISDTVFCAKESDGTIIVVESGKTTKQNFVKTLSNLSAVDISVYGILQNKVKMKGQSSYYM